MKWYPIILIVLIILTCLYASYKLIYEYNNTKELIEFCESKGYDGMKFGDTIYDGNECTNKTEGQRLMDEFDEWKEDKEK